MKIYGKEYDYYDCALAFGQDPLCVWNRKFKINYESKSKYHDIDIMFENSELDRIFDHSVYDSIKLYKGYVFFCGTTYPFITYKDNCFYSFDSLYSELEKDFSIKKLNKFFNNTKRFYSFSSNATETKYLNAFFAQQKNSDELHRIKNEPVYIFYKNREYIGGRLKDFQFYKVVDPYSCFQELNMYISGVLGGQSPKLIEIADEYKIVSSGFDKVTSFRNMKRNK